MLKCLFFVKIVGYAFRRGHIGQLQLSFASTVRQNQCYEIPTRVRGNLLQANLKLEI